MKNIDPKKELNKAIIAIVVGGILIVLFLVLISLPKNHIHDNANTFKEDIPEELIEFVNYSLEERNKTLVVLPQSREMTIEQGNEAPEGFLFSIKNDNKESHEYTYETTAQIGKDCEEELTKEEVKSWMINEENMDSGIQLEAGEKIIPPIIVYFDVPKDAPPCQIGLRLKTYEDGEPYDTTFIGVEIE